MYTTADIHCINVQVYESGAQKYMESERKNQTCQSRLNKNARNNAQQLPYKAMAFRLVNFGFLDSSEADKTHKLYWSPTAHLIPTGRDNSRFVSPY